MFWMQEIVYGIDHGQTMNLRACSLHLNFREFFQNVSYWDPGNKAQCWVWTLSRPNQIDQMGYCIWCWYWGRSPALFVLLRSGSSRLWGSFFFSFTMFFDLVLVLWGCISWHLEQHSRAHVFSSSGLRSVGYWTQASDRSLIRRYGKRWQKCIRMDPCWRGIR